MISSRRTKANKLIRSCAASRIPGLCQTSFRKSRRSTPRSRAASTMAPKRLLKARAAASSLTCASDAGRCENIAISAQPSLASIRAKGAAAAGNPARHKDRGWFSFSPDIPAAPHETRIGAATPPAANAAPACCNANAASNAPAKEKQAEGQAARPHKPRARTATCPQQNTENPAPPDSACRRARRCTAEAFGTGDRSCRRKKTRSRHWESGRAGGRQ